MVSFTKKAPLAAAAALALAASTAHAQFPTDTGKATFASGASITFTMVGNVVNYAGSDTTTGAATISADSYSCDEASSGSAGTIADASGTGAVVGLTVTTDFRDVAGLRVDLGEECALILPEEKEGSPKFYGGVVGGYGSGDATVDGVVFPVQDIVDAGTAIGKISFSASSAGVGGTITPKSGLRVGEDYRIYISDGDNCNAALTGNEYVGTSPGTFNYTTFNSETAPDKGLFTQSNDPDASTDFNLVGLVTTPEGIANKLVRVYEVIRTQEDNGPVTLTNSKEVMCGYISYLPKVRGYIAAYVGPDSQLKVVGKASGLQRAPGILGTMHLHTASKSVDDPVDFPRCTDGNTVGNHVVVPDVKDGVSINDHFLAGLGLKSILTYEPDPITGVAIIDGTVTGYWTLDDVKFQAIVMHTRQAGVNLEFELKAGCGNMGGIDPTETSQLPPNTDGKASSVALSASGLVVAALINAYMM